MAHPKTITIYLAEGEPDGVKTAELSNWIGKTIVIPRSKLKDVKNRDECNQPSIYFLIGKNEENDMSPLVYIGEAEILWSRLANHESNKDFWQIAIGFVGKDNNLTKAHIKFLESRCIEIAQDNSRCILQNSTNSSKPNLPEHAEAEMEEFLENLVILLSSLGYSFLLEPLPKKEKSEEIFYYSAKGAKAVGTLISEGFIVFKNSTISGKMSNAVKERNNRIITSLIKSGHITKTSENLYKFEKNYVFNSPSAASDIVSGNSTSGWVKWKNKDNKTLREIERKTLQD